MTLGEIARQWSTYIRSSEQVQLLVQARLQICDTCPHKKQLCADGSVLTADAANKPDSVYYCGLCGCGLWGKVHDEDHSCPDERWKAVATDESYY